MKNEDNGVELRSATSCVVRCHHPHPPPDDADGGPPAATSWRRLRCVWRGSRRDGRYRTAPRLRHLTALLKRDLFDDEPQRQRQCDQVVHRSCDRHAPSPPCLSGCCGAPVRRCRATRAQGKTRRVRRTFSVCPGHIARLLYVAPGRRVRGSTRRRLAWSGLGSAVGVLKCGIPVRCATGLRYRPDSQAETARHFKSRGECGGSRGARECGAGPPHMQPRGYRARAEALSCRGTRRAGVCARPRG